MANFIKKETTEKKPKKETEKKVKKETTEKKPKKETEKKVKDGYEYINGKLYKKCEEGKIRNPKTNRCIKIKEIKEKKVKKIKNFNTYINYPLNYEFNKENVNKFLEACDKETRTIAKKIIDNTRHISFEEMITRVNKNIRNLNDYIKNKKRPIFILISLTLKEKSNYWLYLYVNDYIKYKYPKREIIILTKNIIDDERLINNDTIVLIDDCIYTGLQMSQNIKLLYNKNNLNLNIFILTSFISKEGEQLIKSLPSSLSSLSSFNIIFNKYIEYIPYTNNFLSYDELDLISSYYTYIDKDDYKYGAIYEEFENKYLIYFDHKLADTISTIPLFYSGVVPNTYNKKLLNNNISIPNNLQIIPLFKNCENIRNINYMKPECPSSPYKKIENMNFMKKMNKKKKALSY